MLATIKIGQFIHGESKRGASLICLVLRLDDERIYTRRITTGDDVQFDRNTGDAVTAFLSITSRLYGLDHLRDVVPAEFRRRRNPRQSRPGPNPVTQNSCLTGNCRGRRAPPSTRPDLVRLVVVAGKRMAPRLPPRTA